MGLMQLIRLVEKCGKDESLYYGGGISWVCRESCNGGSDNVDKNLAVIRLAKGG